MSPPGATGSATLCALRHTGRETQRALQHTIHSTTTPTPAPPDCQQFVPCLPQFIHAATGAVVQGARQWYCRRGMHNILSQAIACAQDHGCKLQYFTSHTGFQAKSGVGGLQLEEPVSGLHCSLPEKQKQNSPMDTGTPDHVTSGGLPCGKPVTATPSQPTKNNSAREAKMPPTERNDNSDRSRSHTVGSTMTAATSTRLWGSGCGSRCKCSAA